jgi:hypothetical protein
MIEANRRSFLGGMFSILAVQTFVPPPLAAMGNRTPRIFGDGRNYDSEGFQALFDGKDVIIPADKIGIRKCEGVIFHRGTFVIDREVYTNGKILEIEHACFNGNLLQWWEAFFTVQAYRYHKDDRTIHNDLKKIIGKAEWLRAEGDMAIDIGGTQYSIKNTHMSDNTRMRSGGYYDRSGFFHISDEMKKSGDI